MSIKRGSALQPALLILLGFWGHLWLDDLAASASAFPLKTFWEVLASGLWLAVGVWAWSLFRRRQQRVVGVVTACLFCLASLFNLLSLWYTWQAELISRSS
ncbi:hypothetical protein [Deinococcus aluminii]|uniref:Uncharacterized protein n=1 Tax=Deinococcus aluminii TaxID=1656885 RepID=A0ABP9XBE2_9DEIO